MGYFANQGFVIFPQRKLQKLVQVGGALGKVAPLVNLPLEGGETAHGDLGGALVVPEAGRLRLLAEARYLRFFSGQVKDAP